MTDQFCFIIKKGYKRKENKHSYKRHEYFSKVLNKGVIL